MDEDENDSDSQKLIPFDSRRIRRKMNVVASVAQW